jgi:hypothetical protein
MMWLNKIKDTPALPCINLQRWPKLFKTNMNYAFKFASNYRQCHSWTSITMAFINKAYLHLDKVILSNIKYFWVKSSLNLLIFWPELIKLVYLIKLICNYPCISKLICKKIERSTELVTFGQHQITFGKVLIF